MDGAVQVAGSPPATATHRVKECCRTGTAVVTGADIVRIARTLAAEPWQFTQTAPAAVDDPEGIVFDKGRRKVTLHLAAGARGCVFLLDMESGEARCGLGDVAPVSCRIHPVAPTNGDQVGERDGGIQRPVPEDPTIDGDTLLDLLRTWAVDRKHWRELIRRWNGWAANQRAELAAHTVEDFQRYLLEAQSAREAGSCWPEEVRP